MMSPIIKGKNKSGKLKKNVFLYIFYLPKYSTDYVLKNPPNTIQNSKDLKTAHELFGFDPTSLIGIKEIMFCSFLDVTHWIVELQTHTYTCSPKVLLCGNKIDLMLERNVPMSAAKKLAEQ